MPAFILIPLKPAFLSGPGCPDERNAVICRTARRRVVANGMSCSHLASVSVTDLSRRISSSCARVSSLREVVMSTTSTTKLWYACSFLCAPVLTACGPGPGSTQGCHALPSFQGCVQVQGKHQERPHRHPPSVIVCAQLLSSLCEYAMPRSLAFSDLILSLPAS